MRVLIITQDEPFYLRKNLDYLFKIIPKNIKIVGCIVSSASPFGKKESFIKKAIKTLKIFGLQFFLHYFFRFIISKIFNPPINKFLERNGITYIGLRGSINSDENLQLIKSYDPDLLISILGNQIFKKALIDLAPKGCINLHTALLPKYRGLMPTFWVLKNNEKNTGVSVFYVDEGIDSGPIIVQKVIEIENRSQADLIKYTKKIGMELIAEAMKLIYSNKVKCLPNLDSEKSYYSFPQRQDVIDFRKSGKRFF
jgi:methionyl-tRNA formyltransferase